MEFCAATGPTTPGQFAATEATVENIIKKLDKVPFQDIGVDLQKAITELDNTLVTAQGTLTIAGAIEEYISSEISIHRGLGGGEGRIRTLGVTRNLFDGKPLRVLEKFRIEIG